MKIAILGTRGIPNNYGGFEQCAEYLSVGLAEKGHDVSIYSPNFHPYKDDTFKGVKIIRKASPQHIFGNSASNFIYDYLCLKNAAKQVFDIILELGLITSSLSIIFCRHRGKVIATNIDGLEWKRSKWNKIVQKITKTLEKYGIKYSDYLIADNVGIQEYLNDEYGRSSEFIAYGTADIDEVNSGCLADYGLEENNYLLSIARLEPENNLEMMFNGYIKSQIKTPYFVVGNHLTDYGDFYAGGGARSVANPQLFSKGKVPSRSIDGIKVSGGWSEIYEGVMNKYTDKPMILSIANKDLIPKWKGLGFKPYNEKTANLPEAVKEKLKGLKYPIYYRDSGEMKKSFAYIWGKYIHKCDL